MTQMQIPTDREIVEEYLGDLTEGTPPHPPTLEQCQAIRRLIDQQVNKHNFLSSKDWDWAGANIEEYRPDFTIPLTKTEPVYTYTGVGYCSQCGTQRGNGSIMDGLTCECGYTPPSGIRCYFDINLLTLQTIEPRCRCDMNSCPSFKEDGSYKYNSCEKMFGKIEPQPICNTNMCPPLKEDGSYKFDFCEKCLEKRRLYNCATNKIE